MKIFLIIISALNLAFSMTALSLFPASNEVTGWDADMLPGCIQGTAFDSASLYSKIDGGAEEYTDRGMVDAAFGGYSDGVLKLCIEIYNQTTEANAKALYAFFGAGEHRTYPNIGDSARIDTSLPFDLVLECIQDSFFCRIRIGYISPEYEAVALDFAQTIMAHAISVEQGLTVKRDAIQLLSCFPDPVIHGCVFTAQARGEQFAPIPLLKIYNCSGQLVSQLSGSLNRGVYSFVWKGKVGDGMRPAPGIFVAKIQIGGQRLIKRFVLK